MLCGSLNCKSLIWYESWYISFRFRLSIRAGGSIFVILPCDVHWPEQEEFLSRTRVPISTATCTQSSPIFLLHTFRCLITSDSNTQRHCKKAPRRTPFSNIQEMEGIIRAINLTDLSRKFMNVLLVYANVSHDHQLQSATGNRCPPLNLLHNITQ